jgi:3-dehydroquinate dehydratase/shikimate dehydrogenase
MSDATIVAAVERSPSPAELKALGPGDWLEVIGDAIDPVALRARFAGTLLFTDRTRTNRARRELLARACATFDFVNLEPSDLVPWTLALIPPARRVVTAVIESGADEPEVLVRVRRLLDFPARLHRLIFRTRRYADTIRPLRLLRELRRDDVAAFADGPLGTWTRMVAPHFGAPFVFAKLAGSVAEDGVPTVGQLASDYGLPRIQPFDELYGIAGDPVWSSLSPRLHNAAFRSHSRRALYLPFHVPDFADFWEGVIAGGALDELGLPMRAICVVSPHKEIALAVAGAKTPLVKRAMSTNFFVREGEEWTADTTDPVGVMNALEDRGIDVARMPVAVVGCGGSGRAIAAALQQAGADVTLVNRGFDRASVAVRLLQLPFVPLAGFSADRYRLVINATPVGRDGEQVSFALDRMRDDAVVIDLVYGNRPTPLIATMRAHGKTAVDGKEILMRQAMSQFRLMTGQEMSEELVRSILGVEAPVAAEAVER